MARKTQNSEPLKILISRLSAHGDVIQTLPLLAALKQGCPSATIGWVVEASAAPLLEGHPDIDHLHISRRKQWLREFTKAPWSVFNLLSQWGAFLSEVKTVQYDVSLDVQGLLKSALIPFLCGVPRRLGYQNTRECAHWTYTEELPYHDLHNPDVPTVIKFREFATALGALPENTLKTVQFPLPPVTERSQHKVNELVSTLNPDWPIIALAPETIWPSKHWPQTHWQALLNNLSQRSWNIVLLGSAQESNAIESLIPEHPETAQIMNWAGQTDLPDLYALFPHVQVLVGLDSAPLHIANAVSHDISDSSTPHIIGLFGPTSPGRTGPIGDAHQYISEKLDCQPCFRRVCPLGTDACMQSLSPEQVMERIDAVVCGSQAPACSTSGEVGP